MSPRFLTYLASIAVVVLCALHVTALGASSMRVAVLDFQPGGAIGEYESLGAGLQSMLTTDLSAVSSLTVVERARLGELQKELKLSRSAAADPKTALKLGKLAGASHVVTGSFTLVGSKMRLDARVVDVATSKVLFSAKIEGERDAFFELEKQLASDVVKNLGVTPSAKERSVLGRVHTADFGAFQKFSEGVRFFDDAEYDRSLQALKEAAQRDEDFKLARTTLDEYERLSAALRSQATVHETEQAAQVARQDHEQRSEAMRIRDRLLEVAAQRGESHAAERAAALVFLSELGPVTGDSFADQAMRELATVRYMQEISPQFPRFAISPSSPFGERWGHQRTPETLAQIPAAISQAALELSFRRPKVSAEDVRGMREESIRYGFEGHAFERVVKVLPLDYRGQTDALQRLYTVGAKVAEKGTWSSVALAILAKRRRVSLEIDESTRLFREAALYQPNPDQVRKLAEEVDLNAEIARAVAKITPQNCLAELLSHELSRGNHPSVPLRYLKESDHPCEGRDAVFSRQFGAQGLLLGDTRVSLVKGIHAFVWSDPRTDPLRARALRYFYAPPVNEALRQTVVKPFRVFMLDGVPRLSAKLEFDVDYQPSADAAEAARLMPNPRTACTGCIPRITVFFGAQNVLAQRPVDQRGKRKHVPMQALGVMLADGKVSMVDVNAMLESSVAGGESIAMTPGAAKNVSIDTRARQHVVVRRELKKLHVDIAGTTLSFDTPEALAGFVGVAIDGSGFVSIANPSLRSLP